MLALIGTNAIENRDISSASFITVSIAESTTSRLTTPFRKVARGPSDINIADLGTVRESNDGSVD